MTHRDEPDKPAASTQANTFAELNQLFRAASSRTAAPPKAPQTRASVATTPRALPRPAASGALDGFLRETAAAYAELAAGARARLGRDVPLTSLFSGLDADALAKGVGGRPDLRPLIASAFAMSAKEAVLLQPFVARLEPGGVALYVPWQQDMPTSVRTRVGNFTGNWARTETDGDAGPQAVLLDLAFAYEYPAPTLAVQLTWVGTETVGVTGSVSVPWSPPKRVLDLDGVACGWRTATAPIAPDDGGWIHTSLDISAGGSRSQYDVWLKVDADAAPPPATRPGRPIVRPVLVHQQTPTPTPTDIPNGLVAATRPDVQREIQNVLTQFILERSRTLDGLISRGTIAFDPSVLRPTPNLGGSGHAG